MKKGINQWCFPPGLALREVFEVSQQAGFSGVELNLGNQGDVGLTLESSLADAKEIRRMATLFGLELKSLSTALMWGTPLSASEASIRQRGVEVIVKQLELASVMEMDTILVVPGLVTEDVTYSECYERSRDELSRLLPRAQELGVRMGVENVWNKFLLSPLEMAGYVDSFESPWMGVYFDVGNVLLTGYPQQWIRILGSRILKVHVKDFNTKVGNMSGFTPLLAGEVNWAAVRKALREIAYEDYVTAELVPYSHHWQQLMEETARKLDVIINE